MQANVSPRQQRRIEDRLAWATAPSDSSAGNDEISRGTTVFELLDRLREQGARSVAVACTHGLFADNALDKLAAADVTEVVCTNTAPVPLDHPKLHVLSVAPALAEAISRIHNGESVSALFDH